MCVCVRACSHKYMYTRMYMSVYTRTCMYIYVCLYITFYFNLKPKYVDVCADHLIW